MSEPDPIELQRFRYQQGQGLRSADRRDQMAIEAQLRAWHNRAKHNAYGVAEGLNVQLSATEAVVAPGLAYDVRGRELILQKPHRIRFPQSDLSTSTTWLLIARYKQTSEFPKRNENEPDCFGHAASAFLETPELFWKVKAEWSPQDGVPLASVNIDAAGVTENEEFVRPREHGLARRRVVTGATLAGSTEWEVWNVPLVGLKVAPGIQVKVRTNEAGFTRTPCYFAWIQRVPPLPLQPATVIAPFAHIDNESINSFTFRLWLPQIIVPPEIPQSRFQKVNSTINVLSAKQKLYVSWMAIEEGLKPLPIFDIKRKAI